MRKIGSDSTKVSFITVFCSFCRTLKQIGGGTLWHVFNMRAKSWTNISSKTKSAWSPSGHTSYLPQKSHKATFSLWSVVLKFAAQLGEIHSEISRYVFQFHLFTFVKWFLYITSDISAPTFKIDLWCSCFLLEIYVLWWYLHFPQTHTEHQQANSWGLGGNNIIVQVQVCDMFATRERQNFCHILENSGQLSAIIATTKPWHNLIKSLIPFILNLKPQTSVVTLWVWNKILVYVNFFLNKH